MESILTRIIRSLLGLLLLVAGTSKLYPLMPNPPHNEAATAFMGALAGSGYMIPLIAVVEITCGAAFLLGRYVALAAIVLTPLALNIVLFHALLDPSGGAPGFFVGAATLYLLAVSYPRYQEILREVDSVSQNGMPVLPTENSALRPLRHHARHAGASVETRARSTSS